MDDFDFKPRGTYIKKQFQIPNYLKKYGLENIRNSTKRELRGYGIQDIDPIDVLDGQKSLRLLDNLIRICKNNSLLRKLFQRIAYLYTGMSLEQKLSNMYLFSKYFGMACTAKPLEQLSDFLIGNPKHVYKVGNKNYTFSLLRYYNLYAETCKIIDYSRISTILEIGSGLGMQAEIFKKLYPNITIFLVDLPALLLLQKQYLSTIFPNKVVWFNNTNDFSGKIVLLKPENIMNVEFDLLWNSVSFQIMDINVAKKYLKIINKQAKKFICLHNKMEYDNKKPRVAKKDYLELLSNFDLINYNLSDGQAFTKDRKVDNVILKRKSQHSDLQTSSN